MLETIFRSRPRLIRAVAIQLGIAGVLAAWFLVGMPRLKNEWAAEETAKKEGRIQNFIQSLVADDPARNLPAGSAEGYSHPQRLLNTPSEEEVKQTLGPADGFSGDFRGGVHLIWTGSNHKLEASFNNGRLYCLRVEDVHTGHGALVFESSLNWQVF
ncbi:MAG TPA: hypothetical protein VKV95_05200 [Terriglobia bacterium]|nr:hypothetical protein [Terriglobia bacterium]